MVSQWEEVFEGKSGLSIGESLDDLLELAGRYGLKVLMEVVCFREFGHTHPDLLSGDDAELFIERARPIVMAAHLQGKRRQ